MLVGIVIAVFEGRLQILGDPALGLLANSVRDAGQEPWHEQDFLVRITLPPDHERSSEHMYIVVRIVVGKRDRVGQTGYVGERS